MGAQGVSLRLTALTERRYNLSISSPVAAVYDRRCKWGGARRSLVAAVYDRRCEWGRKAFLFG